MNGEPVFSRNLLTGWIAVAVVVFALSMYFMGTEKDPDSVGASTFSRSAIGHAGIAEVLQRLGIPVVKSKYNSLEKLSAGSVAVIAEPRMSGQSEETIRGLLKANTILLVLPKWIGVPSEQTAGWIKDVIQRPPAEAEWALKLVAPRGTLNRESAAVNWTTNALGLPPNLAVPIQLIRGDRLRPIIAGEPGMLIGEITDRDRRIWVLSDPDIISNHGLAREGNAALAVAMIKRLRGEGPVVFDETIHGYTFKPANPFLLMFRFPFVVATVQGALAIALLLWATLARFGAPQSAPPPLRAGREGLLQNVAKLIEFTGHQQVMVRRYVQETIRDVARQLHAPRGLSGEALLTWLRRVGTARSVDVDCGAVVRRAGELGEARRRDPSSLVRIARDIHRWKREIIDGRPGHPGNH